MTDVQATVLSWTTVHRPPAPLQGPLVVALLQTTDGTALLAGSTTYTPRRIGEAVTIIMGHREPPSFSARASR